MGAKTAVQVVFDVPNSVKELTITEAGVFVNVKGFPGAYLQTQKFTP